MGQLHHFLGIEVRWHDFRLYLTQTRYIAKLLMKFELQNLKPYPILILAGKTMSNADGEVLKNVLIYRSAI